MIKSLETFILKENQIDKLVDFIIKEINSGTKTILLDGNLGVGKTRLTQELIKHYLPDTIVQSPTFVIERVYKVESKIIKFIHHLDLYRIKYYSEFIDLGFHDLIKNPDTLLIIEWPKLVEEKIPHWLKIKIEYEKNGKARKYQISKK